MSSSGSIRTVYHYTDQKGKEGIERTGQIKPSPAGAYGPGVYFTSIPPTAGRTKVSKNNGRQRVDYALEVQIPVNKLKEHTADENHSILTHDGPVNLSSYRWKTLWVS